MSEPVDEDGPGSAADPAGEAEGPDSKRETEDRAERSTERTAVRTYVPRYQKEEWTDQADELDMSLSEFVRTMTQAGRRGFGGEAANDSADASEQSVDETASDTPEEEPGSGHATPGVEEVETVLLEALRQEPRTYDDLVEVALGDVRESVADEVGDALQELQASNEVTHDPRAGGYTLPGE